MSPRVISSAQTFIIKFIIPVVAVVFFAFANTLADRGTWPIFLPLEGIACVSIYWYYVRLKKVAIDSEGLVISNYIREVRVPWRDIIKATGSRWLKTRQVAVTFDRDIGFGTSIVFMPKFRFLWPGREHPIAQELRDLMLVNRDRR